MIRLAGSKLFRARTLRPRGAIPGLVMLAASLIGGPAWAAFVTTQEAGVEAIYAQAGFSDPIDFRFMTTIEFFAPDLLDVDNESEWDALAAADFGLDFSTVRLFYVDNVNWCGSPGSSLVGCANTSFAVVDSTLAGESGPDNRGDNLIAHELGHVFSLDHVTGVANNDRLMFPQISANRELLIASEIDRIFNAHQVQEDGQGFFVNVAPILIVGPAPVPLPAPFVLMLGALAPIVAVCRRRAA